MTVDNNSAEGSQAAWAEQWRAKETNSVGTHWAAAITPHRASELTSRVFTWGYSPSLATDAPVGPFQNYVLTGADVFWLATQWIRRRGGWTEEDARRWLRAASVEWWSNRPTPTGSYSSFSLPPL